MAEPVVHGRADGRTIDVLFLDDMAWRHVEFARFCDRHGVENVRIWRAWSAKEAIEMLDARPFDQVFLDHDLSDEDIMIPVGHEGTVPTGMIVVEHILQMPSPPQDVVVHSCNDPARDEMVKRLTDSGKVARVTNLAFTSLIRRAR